MEVKAPDSLIARIIRHTGPQTGYLPTLDGWRAIAICIVLFGHGADSLQALLRRAWVGADIQSLNNGDLGVQLFFALSGLLITTGLINEAARWGNISLNSFYTRRIFRILPPAVAMMGVALILRKIGMIDFTTGRWLASLLFYSNLSHSPRSWYLGHFWSLSIEEQFYLFWPAAFLLLFTNRRRLVFTLATIVILSLWRAIDYRFHVTNPFGWWDRTDIRADNLLWGVAAALWFHEYRHIAMRVLKAPLTLAVLCLTFIAAEWAMPRSGWKMLLFCVSVKNVVMPLMMIATLLNARTWYCAIFETATFRVIGRLSYSLYIWQEFFMVSDTSAAPRMHVIQVFPINILCTFGVALVSYFLFEQPCIEIGRKLAKKMRRGADTVAPVAATANLG